MSIAAGCWALLSLAETQGTSGPSASELSGTLADPNVRLPYAVQVVTFGLGLVAAVVGAVDVLW